jgi:LCP family protein required for cell wall assembly
MTTRTNINHKQEYYISSSAARFFSTLLAILFLVSGAYLGYLFYSAVKETVATVDVPTLPYIDLTLPTVGEQRPTVGIIPQRGGEIPVTGITGVPLPDYEKKERVNILLLGIDKRPDEQYARTDTMILVTVDPENKTAGMVSIPRDLWVEIPGFNESRINTAHYLGDKNGYPGGGPALAMQTVQYHFGVPVHFFVKVDFEGFREIVDTLGGIEVDVPIIIDDPTFPDQNYGYDPFYIEAGQQHLDGATALKYARTRHAPGSDFGRAARQQQVLLAIKDKALQLGILPKVPELWTTMAGTVETDLQLIDILELAELADKVTADKVEMVVLGEEYTAHHTTEKGAMVLIPLREKIQAVIDRMFAEVEVQGPSQAEIIAAQAAAQEVELQAQEQQRAELKAQLGAEGAKVVIQNGTDKDGLDAETAIFLKEQGFDIAQFGPSDMRNYPRTVIVDYSGKEYTLGTLVNFFNVAPENVRRSTNLKSDVDIRVIIGADFELPQTTPQSSLLLH